MSLCKGLIYTHSTEFLRKRDQALIIPQQQLYWAKVGLIPQWALKMPLSQTFTPESKSSH